MLKLSDMARRPDFEVGTLCVSPSRRTVSGPAGKASLEPQVMQLLLLLLDARGEVVIRKTIFDECWGSSMVGDGSINRAVSVARRAVEKVAPGAVEIETIPRAGYRANITAAAIDAAAFKPVSRRVLIAGAAGLAAAGAGGLWWRGSRDDPAFTAAMERGKQALRLDAPESVDRFREAVAIDPGNAKAWGLLAYALASRANMRMSSVDVRAVHQAERAARTALEIDPAEANAMFAMTIVQGETLDWISREARYRSILEIDPGNSLVMSSLGQLLHGVGRCREALAVGERALAIEPLSPNNQLRKALRLWVIGRVAEADQVSNRAVDLWPSHGLVRMARLMIYAYTGRTRAALAIVEAEERKPILLLPGAAAVLRSSLAAMENPTPATIGAARTANVEGARRSPAIAAWAVLTLSKLGELDAAFDVANGFLLGRGSVIVRRWTGADANRVNNMAWRNTYGLFTPPTEAMRLDPRFGALADGLGLSDYWRRRGISPDAFLFNRPAPQA